MRKNSLIILLWTLVCLTSRGQDERLCFNHLEVGLTACTTGFGFDVAMPMSESFRLRTGFDFMLHTKTNATLDVLLNGESYKAEYDDKGHRTDRLGKVHELIGSFTGYQMDEIIDVCMKPTMWNFRLLVDWFPFETKDWHFSAGVFAGPSQIALLRNTPESMNTITGLCVYNGMYNKIMADKPIVTVGNQSIEFPAELKDRVKNYGLMSIPVGTLPDGTPYSLNPGNEGLVEATVTTNWLRPYLGVGYTCALDKAGRTSLAFDLGMLIWGGKPSIKSSDGADLVNDVQDLEGKVGRWVDRYSSLPVFPVVELRISRRLF